MAKRSATGEPPARGSSKLNLEDLLLENVEITRETIGSFGTCGKVSKAYYYGSPCTAIEFHRSWTSTILDSKAFDSKGNPKTPLTRGFMKECLRCTKLRHPNVVQFFGISYEVPGSAGTLRGPVLIMEKMGETLNSYLTKTKSVEMFCKLSILLDISQGLMYLHSRDPQIVHGGLTSHDVLLTDSPTPQAKITGNPNAVRILKQGSTVRQQNKDLIEFLPHSTACNPRCDSTLDVFSYGGIMLHTLTQEWPKPTVYTYISTVRSSGGFKSGNEIERRSRHIKKVDNQILEQLIKSCLDDEASARPSISVVHKAVKNAVSHEESAAAAATARSSTKASQVKFM